MDPLKHRDPVRRPAASHLKGTLDCHPPNDKQIPCYTQPMTDIVQVIA